MRSRGPMPSALSPSNDLLQRHALLHQRELAAFLLHADARARHDGGAAARQRRRLAHLRGFRNADGEVALRHRDRRDAHVAADDDHAGAFVDDDLGRFSGSTCNCSMSVSISTTFSCRFFGSVSCTVEDRAARRPVRPCKSLIATAIRLAVVEVGLRKASATGRAY